MDDELFQDIFPQDEEESVTDIKVNDAKPEVLKVQNEIAEDGGADYDGGPIVVINIRYLGGFQASLKSQSFRAENLDFDDEEDDRMLNERVRSIFHNDKKDIERETIDSQVLKKLENMMEAFVANNKPATEPVDYLDFDTDTITIILESDSTVLPDQRRQRVVRRPGRYRAQSGYYRPYFDYRR